ncbi:MAG: DUF2079 domain-containing protein [Nitrososphaerota archaeon]
MRELDAPLLILMGASIILAAYLTYIQVHYHETYNTFAWDLGIFLQSLESFIFRGKVFYNTVELPYNPSGSYFGIHFSPILFLFAIPYAIYPYPLTLFLIKNLLIYLTSPILYKVGREQGLSKVHSALIAITYLFFLPLYGPLTFDFHPYSTFPFFMSLTHLYVVRGRYRKALLMTLLGLSTNEIAALLYGSYAIALFLKGSREISKQIASISAVWLATAFFTILSLNPIQWRYYFEVQFLNAISDASESLSRSNILGDGPLYFLLLYGLLLFLPLFSPLEGVLAVIPWLLIASVAGHSTYVSPYFQYSALIASQLFLAAMNTLKKFQVLRTLVPVLMILNVSSAIFLGPIGLGALDYTTNFVRPVYYHTIYRFDLAHIDASNVKALDNAVKIIPENASILVQPHVFPHVYKHNRSYVSLIPGVNGWPIVFQDLNLREIRYISIFSAPSGRQEFQGIKEVKELILNGEKLVFTDNNTVKLAGFTKIKDFIFRCRLRPENIGYSQVILHSEAFELGMGSNGYLVLLIYSSDRESTILFSDKPLKVMEFYELEMLITQNEITVKVNGETMIKTTIKNRVVAWLVDNVDYIILDSSALASNFRIGSIPLILNSGYKLIAAGDGVMVFSNKNDFGSEVLNLSNGRYTMLVYPNDDPMGEPVIVMPLSELKWKSIGSPLAPQCAVVNLKSELVDVNISGAEKYAFAKSAERAYSADNLEIRCSAIIRGVINILDDGYYVLKVKKMIPSLLDISIDGRTVNIGESFHLSSGNHSIEIVWRKIRHPLLEIRLEKVSNS